MVRWPSGLRRTLGVRVGSKESRGFESHSHRYIEKSANINAFFYVLYESKGDSKPWKEKRASVTFLLQGRGSERVNPFITVSEIVVQQSYYFL